MALNPEHLMLALQQLAIQQLQEQQQSSAQQQGPPSNPTQPISSEEPSFQRPLQSHPQQHQRGVSFFSGEYDQPTKAQGKT